MHTCIHGLAGQDRRAGGSDGIGIHRGFGPLQDGGDLGRALRGVIVSLVMKGPILMAPPEAGHVTDLLRGEFLRQFVVHRLLGTGTQAGGTIADIDLLPAILFPGEIIEGGRAIGVGGADQEFLGQAFQGFG